MYMSTPPMASTIFLKPLKLMIAPASNRLIPVYLLHRLGQQLEALRARPGSAPGTRLPYDIAALSLSVPPLKPAL